MQEDPQLKQLNLILALATGLAGGAVSRYLLPQTVQAQSQTPKEIRAQRFVLVDADGKTLGTLSVDVPPSGTSARGFPIRESGSIRLFDDRGYEIWRNPPSNGIVPATR